MSSVETDQGAHVATEQPYGRSLEVFELGAMSQHGAQLRVLNQDGGLVAEFARLIRVPEQPSV